MNTVGLYIHIPFCVKKCNYCDFYSICGNSSAYNDYLDILNRSMTTWSEKLKDKIIDTVYIGGGTPSVLGTDRISKIIESIYEKFCVTDDAEITIEVNPNSTNDLNFAMLKKSGVNRVSVGIQSANDRELQLLGRQHSVYDSEKTVEHIISGGIDNVSVDVMLGIPMQTIDSLSDTLSFCIKCNAAHISTYLLKIEKNTPFYTNPKNLTFADDDLQADLYEYTCNKLLENGFRHYEISNFCRDNKYSRHNLKYWVLEDYVGIGPSAHSMLDGTRFYYPRSIEDFAKDKIVFESKGKTPDEYLMLSLRTDFGFSFKKYSELFKSCIPSEFLTEAKKLEKLGLLKADNDSIVLTEKGYLVSNTIISMLLNTGIG